MAAPTVKATAQSLFGGVTIPASTSVGDLLIGQGFQKTSGSMVVSDNNPSGWTKIQTGMYWKIAEVGDASSSVQFSAGNTSLNNETYNGVVVVEGHDSINPINVFDSALNSGNATRSTNTIDPTLSDTLCVLFVGVSNDNNSSGYSGGSISFTEQFDAITASGGDRAIACATGSYASDASLSITCSTSGSTVEAYLQTVFIQEPQAIVISVSDTLNLTESISTLRDRKIDVSDSVNLTESISVLRAIPIFISETLNLSENISTLRNRIARVIDSLDLTENTVIKFLWNTVTKNTSTWTDESKNTSTWTNEDK